MFGKNIYTFMGDLQKLGFENVLILGEPGTGKSSGLRGLAHDTNIWYNADNKNPIWLGGKEEYGKKTNPRVPYHIIPTTYAEIIDHIKQGLEKDVFEKDRWAFITGHTEQYKYGAQTKERLKTLGKVATKMQLEGKLESVFYSRVRIEAGKPIFELETQNDGYNTARSPQDLFKPKIPNDYGLILTKLMEY